MKAYLVALLLLACCTAGFAQSTTSDPKAVDILTQSLAASGAANVQSFTAQGSITYFWGKTPSSGTATISIKGSGQLRIDSSLSGGTDSMALNNGSGAHKDLKGTLTTIPLHNTLSMGGSPFPYLAIAEALNEQAAYTMTYVGLVASGDRELHQVRIAKAIGTDADPKGVVAKLSQTDYFIDSQTFLVSKIADKIHPIQTLTEDYPREMQFDDYSNVNGVAFPATIRQTSNGRPLWEFHLSTITWNAELTDSAFVIQ